MTKDAIAAIRSAEEQAEVLCRVAGERAAEMRSKIEQEGAAHCERTEAELKAEYAEELAAVSARTEALIARKLTEAQAEAQALAALARTHMDEAVKLIIWGIVEKCQ